MADKSSCIFVAWFLGGNENGMPQLVPIFSGKSLRLYPSADGHKESPKLISVKTTTNNLIGGNIFDPSNK